MSCDYVKVTGYEHEAQEQYDAPLYSSDEAESHFSTVDAWDPTSEFDDAAELADDYSELPVTTAPSLDPREVVSGWRIMAVGHRPQDFMARDLLHGSLFRDRRTRWFHNLTKKPPEWMKTLVAHLPPQDQPAALQHVVLHYLHRRWLAQLLQIPDHPDGCSDPETLECHQDQASRDHYRALPAYRQLLRMWRCWPYGVQVSSEKPGTPFVCGLARLCPWCHGRKVVRLYNALRQGPLADPQDKYLIQARVLVSTDECDQARQAPYSEEDQRRVKECRDRGLSSPPARYRDDQPAYSDITWIREKLGEQLLKVTQGLGVEGGVLTFQVRPYELELGEGEYQFVLNLVGAVTLRTREEKAKFQAAIGVTSDPKLFLKGNELAADIVWLMLPAEDPRALRFFLAGSSVSYTVNSLDLAVTRNTDMQLHNGIPGALERPPMFLMGERDWYRWATALKGKQLYSRFGNWCRGTATQGGKAGDAARSTPPDTGKTSGKPGQALKDVNRARQEKAQDRRNKLLAAAKAVWSGIPKERSTGRGRPAYRRRLSECLQRQGLTISDRDLRWLIRALRERGVGIQSGKRNSTQSQSTQTPSTQRIRVLVHTVGPRGTPSSLI